jgi:hypothetical protein
VRRPLRASSPLYRRLRGLTAPSGASTGCGHVSGPVDPARVSAADTARSPGARWRCQQPAGLGSRRFVAQRTAAPNHELATWRVGGWIHATASAALRPTPNWPLGGFRHRCCMRAESRGRVVPECTGSRIGHLAVSAAHVEQAKWPCPRLRRPIRQVANWRISTDSMPLRRVGSPCSWK